MLVSALGRLPTRSNEADTFLCSGLRDLADRQRIVNMTALRRRPALPGRGPATPSVRFDYVNAGVPGYGYDSILKSLELRVKPLHPDIVVIYEAANDLSFESRLLAQRQGLVGNRAVQESWLARYSLLPRTCRGRRR